MHTLLIPTTLISRALSFEILENSLPLISFIPDKACILRTEIQIQSPFRLSSYMATINMFSILGAHCGLLVTDQ